MSLWYLWHPRRPLLTSLPPLVPFSPPFCQTLAQLSFSELLVYMSLWYPWPLSEPEMRMRALGLDLLSTEGAVLVTLQDIGDVPVGASLEGGRGEVGRCHDARGREGPGGCSVLGTRPQVCGAGNHSGAWVMCQWARSVPRNTPKL
jgi:hypothetical protein